MADLEKMNPCGDDKEIDEYLDGTICEVKVPEEAINDIEAPSDEKLDVDEPDEPEQIIDEYAGKLQKISFFVDGRKKSLTKETQFNILLAIRNAMTEYLFFRKRYRESVYAENRYEERDNLAPEQAP